LIIDELFIVAGHDQQSSKQNIHEGGCRPEHARTSILIDGESVVIRVVPERLVHEIVHHPVE